MFVVHSAYVSNIYFPLPVSVSLFSQFLPSHYPGKLNRRGTIIRRSPVTTLLYDGELWYGITRKAERFSYPHDVLSRQVLGEYSPMPVFGGGGWAGSEHKAGEQVQMEEGGSGELRTCSAYNSACITVCV